MVKIFIKTYGCQSNIADSEQLIGSLEQKYEIVDSVEKSDVVILNSCSVKSSTQHTILNFIRNIPKNKKLFIGGCLTGNLDLRKYLDNIDAIFDTNSILRVKEIIDNPRDLFSDKREYRINVPRVRKNKDIAIINISQGCLGNCSFCSTKLSRGNLMSYKIEDIKKEFERAVKDGCKKIYLSSQDNGCYGFDINTSLPKLLNELLTVEGDYKVRIGMMNPCHVTKIVDDLIEIYKNDKVMKFVHIPVQSGSNKILKHMGRKHSIETFEKLVKRFREEFPDINIASDIIIGYPLETEEDFKKTVELIEEIKPEVLNISMFGVRKGTKAEKLKQLDSRIIKKRAVELDKIYKKIKKN